MSKNASFNILEVQNLFGQKYRSNQPTFLVRKPAEFKSNLDVKGTLKAGGLETGITLQTLFPVPKNIPRIGRIRKS